MKRFVDKVVVVTGGSSGIGRATALEFAKEGAKVLIGDLDDEGGKKVVEEITKMGGEAAFIHTDVSKEEDVKRMIEEAVRRWGRIDILFNNAGYDGLFADASNYPSEDFHKTISVNLAGAFYGIKHVASIMKKQGGGVIVNTASIGGMIGLPGGVAYNSSKAGIIEMTKSVAVEYAESNIRINSVAPGGIETPMMKRLESRIPGFKDITVQLTPMKRLGKPEEVAKAVLFIASDDAKYITGIALPVDGGFTAGVPPPFPF